MVAAHPKLSVPGDQPKVSNNWGVNDYLYNTDEYSLTFVKNVLDEVLELFPGKYIHLGGDEAIKDQWKASPAVQAQIKALGLANEDELQNWFMQQLGLYLAERDRIMVGWDEILDAAVPVDCHGHELARHTRRDHGGASGARRRDVARADAVLR